MLNDNYRVSRCNQRIELHHKLVYIGCVKPGRRLIENVNSLISNQFSELPDTGPDEPRFLY
jgi:hypothetical protein